MGKNFLSFNNDTYKALKINKESNTKWKYQLTFIPERLKLRAYMM